MPRVIALGGASAAPNPGQGCSGYLIEEGATKIVLDLGPDTLAELLRHTDLSALSGIVITHLHVDHVLDLVALWWGWLHRPVQLPSPIPLWLPPDGAEALRRVLSTLGRSDDVDRFFGEICDVSEYRSNDTIDVGGARVSFAPTVHYVPCWAVRVELNDSSVAYTADTGPAADLTPVAREAGLLIAEAMLVDDFDEAANRGSSTPLEAATLARDAHAQRLMLTHFWSDENAQRALRQASAIFDEPITVARPGRVVSW
jgi:ribonuclease BN (tRNA processing enzyme)